MKVKEKYHPDQLLVYFASPYTSDIPMIVARRYEEIRQITADVLRLVPTIVPFSPICYTHQFGHLNIDWLCRMDFHMLDVSDACIVVMQEDWLESEGVTAERDYCQRHDIPLFHCFPHAVLDTCRELWDRRLEIKEQNKIRSFKNDTT